MSFWKKMGTEEEIIVRRAVKELRSGMVVNLGIGMPTFVPGVLPADVDVVFQSENGFTGMGTPLENGTPDNDIIDAGGRACTLIDGAACFDSVTSFGIIRGGNLDMAILGAFEVSLRGDLANWMIPGKLTPGMGGGMELAQKANHVLVVSRHLDKKGRGKLVPECTLPLTAPQCVDTLVTDRALFRRIDGWMTLCSVHPDHTEETALEGIAADVRVADDLEPW
ncbi:hypothetical protein KQI84_01005 [bacterium]|nr:hypothetical protein [bacterium]